MSDVLITGTFTGLSVPEVCESIRRLAASEGRTPTHLKVLDAVADYEDALLEAFIHPILDGAFVAIEAEFHGTRAAARRWLDAYIAALSQQGVHADFDLLEQDDVGTMVGEMISLQTTPPTRPSLRSAGPDILLQMNPD